MLKEKKNCTLSEDINGACSTRRGKVEFEERGRIRGEGSGHMDVCEITHKSNKCNDADVFNSG